MGVNSLPKTITRQRRDCDLNPSPSAPESSTLASGLPFRQYCPSTEKYTGWTKTEALQLVAIVYVAIVYTLASPGEYD